MMNGGETDGKMDSYRSEFLFWGCISFAAAVLLAGYFL